MKVLYIECNMGAAGDMLMSALSELHPDADGFIERLNKLGIPDVRFKRESSVKCGIKGTHIDVKIHGSREDEHTREHHHHSGMRDVEHIIGHLDIPDTVREDALAVYRLIAAAESGAHGVPICDIHFHEVGTMDAIADVVGVCMLVNELSPDKIVVSPVNVGFGQVKCAHGILPVPAPATAWILKGVPTYIGEIKGELCTPTGAALLKHFASSFGAPPVMSVTEIGYGMGTKNFEAANCVRAMLGETDERKGTVCSLSCNIDDMTGEDVGFAVNTLLDNGALDVYTVPAGMKKNRPGVLLTCICEESDKEKFVKLIFGNTSTIGIRENILKRYVLDRKTEEVSLPCGSVRVKISEGYGVKKVKAEYEDLKRIAEEKDISVAEVREQFKLCNYHKNFK